MIKGLLIHFNVICCFGDCYDLNSLTFNQLIFFSLVSIILVSILLTYYNRIPKSNVSKDKLNNPIYQSTDILLQSKNNDASFVIAKKTTSIWVKILVYILITFVVITPLYQLLGVEYFL